MSNLIVKLIISQEQSWPSRLLLYLVSHKWVQCRFMRLAFSELNSQLDGQILFCPNISAGHFQKLFQALYTCTCIFDFMSTYTFQIQNSVTFSVPFFFSRTPMAFFVDMKSHITTMNILQGQGLMITASKDKTIRVSETLVCCVYTSILY